MNASQNFCQNMCPDTKKNNPNLISAGEGLGLFWLLGGQHGQPDMAD